MLVKYVSKLTIYGLVFIAIVFTFFWLTASITVADSFPERENGMIVDPGQHFSQPDKSSFNEYVAQYDHEYVFVILHELTEDRHDYARQLFEHYALGPDALLLLVILDDPETLIYVHGEAFGLTGESLDKLIEKIYVPFAREGNLLTGVRSVISAIENELSSSAEAVEEETPAAGQSGEGGSDEDASLFPAWLKFLLFSLVVLLVLWLAGTLYRYVVYRQVDKLDAWKADLEHRPFSEQLSRVKNLKLSGETEVNFEKWKSDWEDILNTALPKLEEMFIDIEDFARHFRFIRSHQLLNETKQELLRIEQSLDKIVSEIDQLTASEAESREDGKKLEAEYHELRASLQKQSFALGIAYPVLHEKNKKVALLFQTFHEAQENGDYFRAQDLLNEIKQDMAHMSAAIQKMPELIEQVENEIPQKMKELEQAVQEMKDKGYSLKHTQIEHRLVTFHEWKQPVIGFIENSEIELLQKWKDETLEEIEKMFDQLEDEVNARAFVFSTVKTLPEHMEDIDQQANALSEEIAQIKQSYSWDAEWDESLEELQQQLSELKRLYAECQVEEDALYELYPKLKPVLERFQEKHQLFQQHMQAFLDQLAEVREDELKAKEVFERLKRTMNRLKTDLKKSNLPGLPDYVESGIKMADEALLELKKDLQRVPLEITRVQHHIKEAEAQVESLSKVVQMTIEQAQRTEFLIQYANRYRRRDQHVQTILEDAEQAFRQYEYREALEFVEEALDQADKHWRDKVNLDEKSVS